MTYFTETALDSIFRDFLSECGCSSPEAYIWCDGDPQYLGNPIIGRAFCDRNPVMFEQNAITKMDYWVSQNT